MTSKNPVFFMTRVSVSDEEREENMNEVMATAREGFAFSKVTFSDVVLAVAYATRCDSKSSSSYWLSPS